MSRDHAYRKAPGGVALPRRDRTGLCCEVPVGLGLGGAYFLSQIKRFQILFRLIYFIPYTIASVVNVAIWRQVLDPERGVPAQLHNLGVPGLGDISFLGNPNLALPSVAFIDNWHWWGFLVAIFLAAMQKVDPDLYEAAMIDGAGRWRQFRHVTLPSIRPTLVFALIITVMGSLLAFDYIWITTQGGPGGASEVVATLIYKNAFSNFEAGYGAAMGLTLTVVSALVVTIFVVLRRRGWEV